VRAREFARRLAFLLRKERCQDDLESEMRLHRELRAEALQRQGMDNAEAGHAAERRFGNRTLIKEVSADMWTWTWLDDFVKDLWHTGRILASNPLFSVIAALTLALGIGANTAIFSVTNAVLLRTLPVRNPEQLFYLHVVPGQPARAGNTGNSESSFSEYVFERLRGERRVFQNLVAYVPAGFNKVSVRAATAPEEGSVVMVSGDFFSGLGVDPVCGRTFTMQDEKDHTSVAVLGYGFWTRRYEQSCAALGRTVYIKGVPFTVVGVAPRGFAGAEGNPADVWIPLQRRPDFNAWGSEEENYYDDPNWWCIKLLARLAPGLNETRALAMLGPVFQRAAYEHLGGKPEAGEEPRKLVLVPARGIGESQADFQKPLYVLVAMVGLILVIACGNVAMLLTARNAARQREFSIRLAIGGSQARLFRQLLTESLLLVSVGALLGWSFALAATRALAVWSGMEISLSPDARVLLFTIGISVAAALLFGLAPLFAAIRVPVGAALKNSSATAFQSKSKSRTGRIVLVLQVSLCVTLTVAAGLMVRTLRNLESQSLGFRTSGLLVFGLNPQLRTHSDAESVRFYNDLLEKLRELPGVQAATVMDNRIGSGWSNNTHAIVDGRDTRTEAAAASKMMRWNTVGPDYFRTLGVPVRLGRDFTGADSSSAPKVAIINETFAKRFFDGRQPLGRQVSYTPRFAFTVVGVVANSKYTGVRETDIPMAYFPFAQVGNIGVMHIELRTVGDPSAFWPLVRKTVGAYAPDLALLQPMTQRAQFDESISQERLIARLSIFFGGLAILLVATGLYGTLAYSISRRTSELGVRMAIGATPGELLRMVLREGLAISAAGIIVGVPFVLLAARAMASLLYGLAPNDPLTIGAAALGITLVSVAASLIPALRAASVDPLVALRYE
jgi:predicted permease